MRIAIDVAQTCTQRAGCAWHANNLAYELSMQVASEDLILYHDFGNWINTSKSQGTRIVGVAEPFLHLSSVESRNLWNTIENREGSLPGKPDIVISTSFMCPKLNKVPQIYTIYDLCFWTHSKFSTDLNRNICQSQLLRSLRHADAFVFISQQSLDDFERLFPRWLEINKKPFVQMPPIRARYMSSSLPSSERFDNPESYWLHIGSIEPRKGIDELLDAYEAYTLKSKIKRPLRLIGGKGWKSEKIHKRIKEMSLRLPIRYEGYLGEKQRLSWLDQAFALICSSRYEGYGLPVDEAADAALPVVSTPVPSFQKFTVHSAERLNLDFSRAPDAMVELETNRAMYDTISKANQTVAQKSTPMACTSRLLDFYRSVMHQKH